MNISNGTESPLEPPEFEPCIRCGQLVRADSDLAWKFHLDYDCPKRDDAQYDDLDEHRVIDCRSSVGETMGMIDAAIHCLRVASRGDVSDPVVVEALRDLVADPEVRTLLGMESDSSEQRGQTHDGEQE